MKKVLFALFALFSLIAHSQENDYKKCGVTMETGCKIVDLADVALGASIGVRYDIEDHFYVASGGGFNFTKLKRIGGVYTDFRTVSVPVELGLRLLDKKKMYGVILFGSMMCNIATSGTVTMLNHEKDLAIGGDIGVATRLGIRIHLSGVELTGSYHIPINNNQKGWYGDEAFLELTVGAVINNLF